VNNLSTSSFLLFYVCLSALIIMGWASLDTNWDQKLFLCCCNSWSPHPPSNQLQTEESFTVIHLARKKDSSNNNNNNNNIQGRKVDKFVKITKIGFTNSIPKNLFVWVFLRLLLCFCLLVQLLNKLHNRTKYNITNYSNKCAVKFTKNKHSQIAI